MAQIVGSFSEVIDQSIERIDILYGEGSSSRCHPFSFDHLPVFFLSILLSLFTLSPFQAQYVAHRNSNNRR